MGVALVMSAAPSRLLAQTANWNDGATQNVVTLDSGQLHYRQSKPLADEKSGWWDYTVALSDIDCLQFLTFKTADILSVVGKTNDAVLKKADPYGTSHGYEAALKHFDIVFPPQASAVARALLRDLTGAQPELAKRINTGACAPL